MAQTTYVQPVAAFAGLIADLAPHTINSLKNEESSSVPFGLVVVSGTSQDQFKLPTNATGKVEGITVHSHALDNRQITTDESIPTKRIASIMRDGYVFAVPELAVSKGDPVFYRIANGVADATETQKGSMTNIDDSGTCVRLPNAVWAADGAKDVATKVEIRALPQGAAQSAVIDSVHGALTADTTQFVMETPAAKAFVVEEVVYYNATGLVADAANFFNIKLQHGSTVLANWSTETGQEGSIAADTPVRLTNGSDLVVPPDTRINVVYDETGTATLPAGQLQVVGHFV
jgi:hypothetical protein